VSARVSIESEAWNDPCFVTLARLCGFADSDHALIKCAKLWSWQTENFRPEKPTYVVDADTIEAFLGPGAASAMVRAKLADETPDGFFIRGSVGRIEWLYKRRVASAKGGEVTKGKAENNKRPHGLPPGQPDDEPQPRPNQGPLTLISSPEEALSPAPARAIPAPVPHGESGWHRRQRWWNEMHAAYQRLRESGAVQPNAQGLPPTLAGENEKNLAACERSLRDAGFDDAAVDAKMRHVVLVAEAEALRDHEQGARYPRWFKPALIWDPERFNRAVDTPVEEARTPRPIHRSPPRSLQPQLERPRVIPVYHRGKAGSS
jgi:hypothetical protein